jgi:hypothetical protein
VSTSTVAMSSLRSTTRLYVVVMVFPIFS